MHINKVLKPYIRNTNWLFYKVFSFIKNRQICSHAKCQDSKRILIYPSVNNATYLEALLWKINVAFPLKNDLRFYLATKTININKILQKINKKTSLTLHNLDPLIIENPKKANIKNFKRYNLILCHKFIVLPKIVRYFHKTEIIDSFFYSYIEGITYQKVSFKLINEYNKQQFATNSTNNFQRLFKEFSGTKQSVCFLTGPSISNYNEINVKGDAIKIICNSLVKNKKLLEHIGGPDIITFADPIFHFGASDYAVTFRQHLIELINVYNPFIVVPDFTVPLLLGWFPALKQNLVGIQIIEDEFNLPIPGKMWVKASDNILTMLMLPLAASLTENIHVAGADGRDKNEKYFWKFNPDSQFSGEMQSVFKAHPSFFRDRKYSKYYNNHCDVLNALLLFAESKGKHFVSLTPSKIPALNKRYHSYLYDTQTET